MAATEQSGLTYEALGDKVKAKYPDYAKIESGELGRRVASKYPEYAALIKQPAPQPSLLNRGGSAIAKGWAIANKPVGEYLPQYNKETDALNRAANFSETPEGRAYYMAHPVLAQARSFAAGMERDVGNMLTPAFVASTGLGAAESAGSGLVSLGARAANAGLNAAYAVQGGQQLKEGIEKRDPYLIAAGVAAMLPAAHTIAGLAVGAPGWFKSGKRMVQEATTGSSPRVAANAVATASKENAALSELRQQHAALQKDIDTHSAELASKYKKAEAKAKARNDAQWTKVREKTEGATADIGHVKEVAKIAAQQADPSGSPIFRSITNESSGMGFDELGRPVVNGQPRKVITGGKEVPTRDPNYPLFYEIQYGEPLPLEAEAGKTDFNRLQRWYQYLNDKMYSGGRLEPGTYNALKMTRSAIDETMQELAANSGAADDLAKARKSHRQMMETFRDSPHQPATVASKSFQEHAGEFEAERQKQERLDKVARYDPSIKDTAAKLNDLRAAKENLAPEPKLYRDKYIGEQDIADAKGQKLAGFGSRGAGYALYTGTTGALMSAMRGHFTGAFHDLIASIAMSGGLRAMENPSTVAMLTKVNERDLQAIAQLPPEQRTALTGALKQMVEAAQKKGVQPDPLLVQFLKTPIGPAGAAAASVKHKYNHELYNPRTGHEIGTDDGTTYYDLQTGEQVSFPASAN
jgi:hypothetical protein